ncbi:hypothetical protein ICE98_02715 [Lactococcus lactis]|nr:hypothetical protein [Lactococcus lactis]
MENSLNIIEKMNPNQKINYDRVFQKVRESWERDSVRPKFCFILVVPLVVLIH